MPLAQLYHLSCNRELFLEFVILTFERVFIELLVERILVPDSFHSSLSSTAILSRIAFSCGMSRKRAELEMTAAEEYADDDEHDHKGRDTESKRT